MVAVGPTDPYVPLVAVRLEPCIVKNFTCFIPTVANSVSSFQHTSNTLSGSTLALHSILLLAQSQTATEWKSSSPTETSLSPDGEN